MPDALDESDAQALLRALFPDGVLADDVLAALGRGGSDAERDTRTLGEALWAVLSDNNDIVLPDGREFKATWRWWGGEIADFLNDELGSTTFDYMDFYMCGASGPGPWDQEAWRAGVRLVFRRLLRTGATWRNGSSYPSVVEDYEFVAGEVRDSRPSHQEGRSRI